MAYSKRPNGNLFHNIKGSQSSQAPTQPGISGMGEVESPAKNILLKIAQKGVSRILSKGGNKVKFLPKRKVPVANPGTVGGAKTSFGSKVGNFVKESIKYTIGGGVANLLLGSSDSETKMGENGPKVPTGGKKYDTNMKDFALNSQARRDEYTKRGWKQDHTTTVKGGNKTVSEIKSKPVVKSNSTPTAEVKVNPMPSSTKPSAVEVQKDKNKIDRKSRSIDKKQDKIDQATASGNDKKARRKQRSLDNKKARLSDKGQLDAKYMSNLSGGDESNKEESPVKALSDLKPNLGTGKNQINPNSEFGKKIASAVPYTSRIQASAKYRKPNAAGQYDK